ncbi:galactoside alpha-(1,2)-fucosyltransferase 2-like [Gigantopelta aegis]|uniref:galactoside alpha-(1,2)-fucosyltransferase 2-like n=1 Tax=Gigantopelta aegis TaxID=1735272 RepID=UPI001B888179|nr:galactoside alpha-(1,2)-fucosyltransferase 2-like [Gigantopelta aegis]XP_041356184.1 galactoside alpha-(1,2)-fucosyltransferase 2-like [Gigantopelta aegis]XP_041356185.1 galactoside alpha-(1,2)-fucosyltransferase 2-like [Gigantopelta aegis]
MSRGMRCIRLWKKLLFVLLIAFAVCQLLLSRSMGLSSEVYVNDEVGVAARHDGQIRNESKLRSKVHGQGRGQGQEAVGQTTVIIRSNNSKNLSVGHNRSSGPNDTKSVHHNSSGLIAGGAVGKASSEISAVERRDQAPTKSDQRLNELWNSLGCAPRIEYPKGYISRTSNASDRIMIMVGPGRLGNKMFQYASLVGIARQTGYVPYVQNTDYLLTVFQVSHVISKKPGILPQLGEHSSSVYDSCLEVFPRNQSYLLTGYYQSWRYFKNVESEVKREFRFKDATMRLVREFFGSARFKNGTTTIGVHVRRGDMALSYSRNKGYTMAPKEYLLRAMAHFRNRYSRAIFVACSDDMSWTRNNIVGNDVVHFSRNIETDMAVLANCQHSIISTGSFGWWAAWLAGGETIYYSNFPAKNTWLATQYKKEDYFPPSWIGMGDEQQTTTTTTSNINYVNDKTKTNQQQTRSKI